MELAKYKVCPECGKHNPPNLIECKYCEADLTGVKVVDIESEIARDPNKDTTEQKKTSEAERELVRICECGEHNPPQSRKCLACGEDISDIIPTEVKKTINNPLSYELTSVDGSFTITINKPLIIVGREAELKEYLADKLYVSRQHAKFTIAADKVFVENLSQTNKTFVNNVEIPNGKPIAINDSDEIGLGGKIINDSRQDKAAYFTFKVNT